MKRVLLLLLVTLSGGAGCTFARGDFFGEVDLSLAAAFATPADRDAGGGWQKLDTDYQVQLSSLSLDVSTLRLIDFGESALSFDPANPPPGYSLCHNGHCHGDDGGLYTYEEIEETLSGNGGGDQAVLAVPVGAVDVLAGYDASLECEGACGLPESHIRRVHAVVSALDVSGLVRDARVPPRIGGEVPWSAVLTVPEPGSGDPPPVRLIGTLDLPVDRAHAPRIELALAIAPDAAIFDGIDFAALLSTAGSIDFAAAGSESARAQLFENFSEIEIETEVSR